jgi:Ca-activated chloride channel family protein
MARKAYRVPPVMVAQDPGRERYDGKEVSPVKLTRAEPVSTFSVDVDTGAYANARRFLTQGQMPPRDAVRTEEMINYFRYNYPMPDSREAPFSVTTDVAVSPWNPDTRLMRIGLRGYDLAKKGRPPANLVFLMDVSGSMRSADKLPLVKTALAGLAGELGKQDRVSIVVYAGPPGWCLSRPTIRARSGKRWTACRQADLLLVPLDSSWPTTSRETTSSMAASTASSSPLTAISTSACRIPSR